MKASAAFLRRRWCSSLSRDAREANELFWAHVRTVSEELDYTAADGGINAPDNIQDIGRAVTSLRLATDHVADANGRPTAFGTSLLDYLRFRADFLNRQVKPLLMDKAAARDEFLKCMRKYKPDPLSLTWNKQKAAMKAPAFLTCITNMVLAHALGEDGCDFDPQSLTTVTIDRKPYRTLARRVDGAYPRVINPTAVWEIKEYYYTTSFGSRIADGIYESLLDALELESLEESPHGKIFHYLIVDAAETWWGQGNPYLCRIVDMLHMGYLDEAVFGRETEPALLQAAKQWRAHRDANMANAGAAREDQTTGVTPPPKHRRLSPADRKRRAAVWNDWAQRNDVTDISASDVESADDREIRLRWNRQRKPKREPDDEE